jgi:DNA polymerase-3 subunit delta'
MRFADVPGQQKIKQRLIQSVSENRVSHAQLFLGPEGSGKLAMAIAYGQYINCRNRTPEDSCGVCPSCNKFNKLIHPDLHFIYPINRTKEVDNEKIYSRDFIVNWREFLQENNFYVVLPDWYDKIGIEKKQGLINAEDADSVNQTLAYKAYEAEYKVLIIWMVEKMHPPAANKLLKNLEEPPDKTVFLLISEHPDQVISTVISRTQLVKFNSLEDPEVEQSLISLCQIDTGMAREIAFQSKGNFHKALAIIRKSLDEPGETNLQKEQFDLMIDWLRKVYTYGVQHKKYNELLDVIVRLVGDGSREKQKEFLNFTLHMMEQCLQYHIGNSHLIRYKGEILKFISSFSAFIHPKNIYAFDEEINRAIFHIERNANATLVFTDLSHLLSRLIKIPASAHVKKN